jgi:alcohol dehydrogenase
LKALVLRAHGGFENVAVVHDHPQPEATPGHVVLKVAAASFNHHDLFTVKGMPGIKVPLPVVLGLDLSGTVHAVGAGVEGWTVGDAAIVNPLTSKYHLLGEMLDGGMAEYCRVEAQQLVRVPAGLDLAAMATLPVAYGTAHRMLVTQRTVKAGDRVLVLGASGGVGVACVVLAKQLGCEVIACASSDDKLAWLKSLGADHVVNYNEVDFSKWAIEKFGKPQRRTYEGGVDCVVNFTGGDTWVPSLRCVKRGGCIVVCGATAGHDPKEDLRYVWSFELRIIGSNSYGREDLEALVKLVAEGKIKPAVDKVLPLERAVEGLELMRDRKILGKIVVTP